MKAAAAADWLVLPPKTAELPDPKPEHELLRRLLLGQRELRADFDVLERCLGREKPEVAAELHRERFERARRRSARPRSDAGLDGILADPRLARRILAGAGLVAWSAARRASRSIQQCAETVQEEKLILAGGIQRFWQPEGNTLKASECLDLQAGSWEPIPDMPLIRWDHAGAVLGGCLYVCGGVPPLGRSCMRYHPVRQRWLGIPSMSTARAHAAAAVAHDRLHIMGGHDDQCTWRSAEVFCPRRNGRGAWVEGPRMTACRRFFAAATLGSQVIISGGRGPKKTTQGGDASSDLVVAQSAEALDLSRNTVRPLPRMRVPRANHAATVVGGMLLISGGWQPDTGEVLSSIDQFDPSSEAWSECTSMAMMRPRSNHAAVACGGELLVLGGSLQPSVRGIAAERSVERLDPARSSWEELAPMEACRNSFVAGVIAFGPTAVPGD